MNGLHKNEEMVHELEEENKKLRVDLLFCLF